MTPEDRATQEATGQAKAGRSRVTKAMVERAGKAISDLLHKSAGSSTIRSDADTSLLQLRPAQVSIESIARVALKAGLDEEARP